ncbi:MAG: aminotransferase class I/II-fold pyridoxal phosphate-dependent enzyme [Alphaproteobacteria bacterium]|nr:aminotransferase class I/II-fold pyridoxal phosphate-dependent enzyme [Alphaproteobacteria bacterium]
MTSLSRRSGIPSFLAMDIAREAGARQAAGDSIVRLDVGQPTFGAPQAAIDAAARAMRAETLGYTDALGAAPLRRAIAAWYGRSHGVEVAPERIIITVGASGAFQLAFLALFDPGDRVALVSPGYPPYRHILTALGVEPALVAARIEDGLQMRASHLAEAERGGPIAGALIASPGNPTGSMIPDAALLEIAAACRARDIPLISDEIYHGLTYEAPARSLVDQGAIVISSFSKYWAMTGWRIGWIVAPEPLVKPIERLAQNLFIAAPAVAQTAALGALLADEECEARRAVYAESRAVLMRELPGLGLPLVAPPDGGFYAFVDIGARGDDSLAFCRRALAEAGVAMSPGVDFCDARGGRWVRIAYPQRADVVIEGLERLRRWLG